MGIIYQLTFFLALGLLAIVITIFVFAVSLLGRAMEAAAKSEKEKLAERKKKNAEEMAEIRKEIRKAERDGQIPRGLRRKLEKLERRDKEYEKELGQIRKAPKLLTVKGGVVPCASCLLGTLILSGGAWYLSDIQISIDIIPIIVWGLGLVAIGYTTSHIYRCLRVIEDVAVTSEAAALKKTVEAFKRAQKELAEEKKLQLKMKFEGAQPPLHLKAKSEMLIKIQVGISKGDVARNVAVALWAPPGFDFPDSLGSLPAEQYAGHVSTLVAMGEIIRPTWKERGIKLKVPSMPSSYPIAYRLFCESFDSGFKEFEVIVEEGAEAPK